MYVVIRKFTKMRSVTEAARRAESGVGRLLQAAPGFRAYYVFDAGDGVGGSVTLFEDRQTAVDANEKAMTWVKASLADLMEGEPDVTLGEVLVAMTPEAASGS